MMTENHNQDAEEGKKKTQKRKQKDEASAETRSKEDVPPASKKIVPSFSSQKNVNAPKSKTVSKNSAIKKSGKKTKAKIKNPEEKSNIDNSNSEEISNISDEAVVDTEQTAEEEGSSMITNVRSPSCELQSLDNKTDEEVVVFKDDTSLGNKDKSIDETKEFNCTEIPKEISIPETSVVQIPSLESGLKDSVSSSSSEANQKTPDENSEANPKKTDENSEVNKKIPDENSEGNPKKTDEYSEVNQKTPDENSEGNPKKTDEYSEANQKTPDENSEGNQEKTDVNSEAKQKKTDVNSEANPKKTDENSEAKCNSIDKKINISNETKREEPLEETKPKNNDRKEINDQSVTNKQESSRNDTKSDLLSETKTCQPFLTQVTLIQNQGYQLSTDDSSQNAVIQDEKSNECRVNNNDPSKDFDPGIHSNNKHPDKADPANNFNGKSTDPVAEKAPIESFVLKAALKENNKKESIPQSSKDFGSNQPPDEQFKDPLIFEDDDSDLTDAQLCETEWTLNGDFLSENAHSKKNEYHLAKFKKAKRDGSQMVNELITELSQLNKLLLHFKREMDAVWKRRKIPNQSNVIKKRAHVQTVLGQFR